MINQMFPSVPRFRPPMPPTPWASGAAATARQTAPRLDEEEERSLLAELGSHGMSGVQAAGNLLGLPGSMARDVLGGITTGDWQKYNPVDQLLTPFREDNRVSGRELGRDWGWIGPKDNWGNFWGGMGIEIATDPLSYMTGLFGSGAKTAAGRAATMAGLDPMIRQMAKTAGKTGWRQYSLSSNLDDVLTRMGKDMYSLPTGQTIQVDVAKKAITEAAKKLGVPEAELLQMPLRGAMGFGLPFKQPSLVTGFGPGAQKLAGAMDVVGDTMKYAPGIRHARGMWSPRAGGKFDEPTQRLAESAYDYGKWGKAEAGLKWNQAMSEAQGAHKAFLDTYGTSMPGVDPEETFAKMMRHAMELEQVDVPGTVRQIGDPIEEAFGRFMPGTAIDPTVRTGFEKAITGMRGVKDDIFNQLKAKGVVTADLEGRFDEVMIKHFPRYSKKDEMAEFATRLTPSGGAATASRVNAIAGLPADVVNTMLTDGDLRVKGVAATNNLIRKYGRYLPTKDTQQYAEELASFVKAHDANELFTGSFQEDLLTYLNSAYRLDASANAAYEFLLSNVDNTAGAYSGGMVSLKEAMANAGFDFDQAQMFLQKHTKATVDGTEMIPVEAANAVRNVMQPHQMPAWAKVLQNTVGKFNNAFKSRVTLPFPAFAFRNHTSGTYLNMTSEHINGIGDVIEYGKEWKRAFGAMMRRGKGLTPDELAEMRAMDLTQMHGTMDVNMLAPDSSQILPAHMLDWRSTHAESVKRIKDSPNILDAVPGGTALRMAEGEVISTGAKFARSSEFLTRAPMYTYLRKKGFTPQAAAMEVKKLQFDYGDLAPMEKDLMRHLIPFYTFTRKMSGLLADDLLNKPGGRMAASIKTAAAAHEADARTPDYVSQTASVPMGEQEDGTRKYMTGFGLPWENPLAMFTDPTRPGAALRKAGAGLLAQTTPIMKGPLEWITGQSFFQQGPEGGRQLGDMDPLVGRLMANISDTMTGERTRQVDPVGGSELAEAVLSNMPYSRVLSTARQSFDPRKHKDPLMLASNLLTGMRFSHISPAAQDARVRELADAKYKDLGGRGFTRMHTPQDVRDQMPLWRQNELAMFDALYNTLADRAKERSEAFGR